MRFVLPGNSVLRNTFRSLAAFNYRLWAIGSLVSNIGTWMQRTAQDWLVLMELTQHSAAAVGIVMSLQFGPQMLLTPLAGRVADQFDRRRVLMATQAAQGLLALGLGAMAVSGLIHLWQVYVFAGLLGCVTAFDGPARHSFVSELADEQNLSNAVALNSLSFNAARLIGPAVAGLMIAAVGCGWVFIINAVSFIAVLISLMCLKLNQLYRKPGHRQSEGRFGEGLRYVGRRPDLLAILAMVFLFSTFGLNFPIYISTMSVMVFHGDAKQYGLLTSVMAVGSVIGALFAAARKTPRLTLIVASAAVFGVVLLLASALPFLPLFSLALIALGISAQTFTTAANSSIQLATEHWMRGRVMALYLAILLGGTPLGAPFAGWVADRFGARAGLLVGAVAGLSALLVGCFYLRRYRGMTIRWSGHRLQLRLDAAAPGTAA